MLLDVFAVMHRREEEGEPTTDRPDVRGTRVVHCFLVLQVPPRRDVFVKLVVDQVVDAMATFYTQFSFLLAYP